VVRVTMAEAVEEMAMYLPETEEMADLVAAE
jgi:hypothetical protein